MDDKYRDWLILSTKRPNDSIVWYASGSAGYTTNLITAGRYTEKEAKEEAARVPHHLIAVHVDDAMAMARTWILAANGTVEMERLKSLVEKREHESKVPA